MRRFLFLVLIALIAVLGYVFLYPEQRDVASEKAEYSVTALGIFSEFEKDPLASQKKYLNKTIEISGIISEINEAEITMEEKVFCQFSTPIGPKEWEQNSKITVKGRFIGYDDLLEQVKMDQCTIINLN